MTKDQIDYVTCVIGALALRTGESCSLIFRKLQAVGIIRDYLAAAYDVLHTFSLEYVAEDVIELMKKKGFDFVCSCRKGNECFRQFDIIEGGVANDKVFQTVDLYMAGVYNKEQALQRLVYEMPNNQICFTTQEAIDRCLSFVEHKNY